jgi:23S rRNA pseudouridine2605 synthase/16S rRNA pseudouridine516 synthase
LAREKLDWLSRALARSGVMPLSEAEGAIRQGRVTVRGRVVRQPLAALRPDDVVTVDGVRVARRAPVHVLAFHKPEGAVTSKADAAGRGTVFDLLRDKLPPQLARFEWHAIGRLDRMTSGLLLFTNDERVVAHVTSPKSKLPKRYRATVGAKVEAAKLAPLLRGVKLDDGPAKAEEVERLSASEVALVLTEGRFHQVKRMLGAVGLPVLRLHREAVGGLSLDVAPGEFRPLTPDEIERGLRFDLGG